jgi:hypothetical protein
VSRTLEQTDISAEACVPDNGSTTRVSLSVRFEASNDEPPPAEI